MPRPSPVASRKPLDGQRETSSWDEYITTPPISSAPLLLMPRDQHGIQVDFGSSAGGRCDERHERRREPFGDFDLTQVMQQGSALGLGTGET